MARKPTKFARGDSLDGWRKSLGAILDDVAAKLGREAGARAAERIFAECSAIAFARPAAKPAATRAPTTASGPEARSALRFPYPRIVGASVALLAVLKTVDRIVDSDLPVLILGESGTGKELVARAIHEYGPRRDRTFVRENCAAIPESLLESELFGHVRGAFTGAVHDKRGLFLEADGGCVFLDEIGEMSLGMQAKLMRVLQEGEIRPVGSASTMRVNVRLVSATNRDLRALVADGRFREDLFFRLNVVPIVMPPLRERRDDIPLLVDAFLDAAAARAKCPRKAVAPAALDRLVAHDWPGNVRELENEIHRACAMAGSTVREGDLSPEVTGRRRRARGRPAARPNPR